MGTSTAVTLRPQRVRMLGWLGVGCALVVIGLWKLNGGPWLPGDVSLGWFCVVLGSFGILLPGALLLPGSWYLRAEPAGLTHCVFFKIRFYRWPDVRSITVAGVGTDRRVMVEFSGVDQNVLRRAFSPRLYGVTLEQLVDVLKRYREHYGAV